MCPSRQVPGPAAADRQGEAILLARARASDAQDLRRMALAHDWDRGPERVLGWIMAQKSIDLATALGVFLQGAPERFNYMPKRDLPAAFLGAVRLLDNICLRVNSGFYLAYPGTGGQLRPRIDSWLGYQRADRTEGRRGRWVFDERVLDPLLLDTLRPAPQTPRPQVSLWRELMSPVVALGVDRDLLKYLPDDRK